jgi:hypothetical protein
MALRIWLNIENIYVSRGNNRSKTNKQKKQMNGIKNMIKYWKYICQSG